MMREGQVALETKLCRPETVRVTSVMLAVFAFACVLTCNHEKRSTYAISKQKE